jgi:transcriptional regulator with XRE-family HTH domain
LASEHQSAAARRRLGAELRSLRERKGLTGQQLADQVGWSQAKVSRIEGARTRAPVEDVAVLLTALEVPPAATPALLDLAAEAAGPAESWRNSSRVGLTRRQQDFINSEAAAVLIRHYQPLILPGYLQTSAYARRVIELAGVVDVERHLAARLARGGVLTGPTPPKYEIVLMEAVLRWRPIAPAAMAEQLRALEVVARRRNVSIRVVTLDHEQSVYVQHPFVLYDFNDQAPPEALVETLHTDLRLRDAGDVQSYLSSFGRLAKSALSQSASLGLIRDYALDMESRA